MLNDENQGFLQIFPETNPMINAPEGLSDNISQAARKDLEQKNLLEIPIFGDKANMSLFCALGEITLSSPCW